MKIGEIEYNAVGTYYWEQYPGLQNGVLTYSFSYNNQNYTIEVFYNTMADDLFYTIKNQGGTAIQSQMLLGKNINLICNLDILARLTLNNDLELNYEIL